MSIALINCPACAKAVSAAAPSCVQCGHPMRSVPRKRNVGYVIDHLGDRPIDTYSSADAASFRDWLIARGLNVSSIARIFGTVKAVVNLTIQELGLDCSNAFLNIYLPKKEEEN